MFCSKIFRKTNISYPLIHTRIRENPATKHWKALTEMTIVARNGKTTTIKKNRKSYLVTTVSTDNPA